MCVHVKFRVEPAQAAGGSPGQGRPRPSGRAVVGRVVGGSGGPAVPSQPRRFTLKLAGAGPGDRRAPCQTLLGATPDGASWRCRCCWLRVLTGPLGWAVGQRPLPVTHVQERLPAAPRPAWGSWPLGPLPSFPWRAHHQESGARKAAAASGCPSGRRAVRRRPLQVTLKPEDRSNACACYQRPPAGPFGRV